jgi:hypothetical protein
MSGRIDPGALILLLVGAAVVALMIYGPRDLRAARRRARTRHPSVRGRAPGKPVDGFLSHAEAAALITLELVTQHGMDQAARRGDTAERDTWAWLAAQFSDREGSRP